MRYQNSSYHFSATWKLNSTLPKLIYTAVCSKLKNMLEIQVLLRARTQMHSAQHTVASTLARKQAENTMHGENSAAPKEKLVHDLGRLDIHNF